MDNGSFISLEQIKREFEIKAMDLKDIRSELNNIRSNYHPDKNHGEFKNESEKNKYNKVDEAIKFIDNLSNNPSSLMIIDKITDLMKVVTDLVPKINDNSVNIKQNEINNNIDKRIEFYIKERKRFFFIPKISFSVLSSLTTFIFLFPKIFSEHPILSNLIKENNSITLLIIWLILLVITGFIWFYSYISNESVKDRLNKLKTESFQNALFKRFIEYESKEYDSFTKDDIMGFTRLEIRIKKIGYDKNLNIDEIIINVCESIINRAEMKKIIEKTNDESLSDYYRLTNIGLEIIKKFRDYLYYL